MPYCAIRGVNHYYEWITAAGVTTGTPPDAAYRPQKPVMVFIHGWGGSSRYWRSTAQAQVADYDCLLYDMRGFGRSTTPVLDPSDPNPSTASTSPPSPAASAATPPDSAAADRPHPYQLEAYVEDFRDLLDILKLDRIHLNAHSLGASMALLFLNCHADRVDRAILTCNGLLEYNALAFRLFHIFSRYVVLFRPRWFLQVPQLDRVFMSRFLSKPIAATERRAFLEDFLDADFDAAYGTAVKTVSQEMAEATPQEYARLTVPTLLVSGQYDQIITAPMGKAAADLNPQVTYRCVAGTGHFPMLEDTPTYLEYVRNFLGS
ncbi:MAG: alpha/beta hydrolase [Prochlorothrix sp.]|nr:alpha/beta hydrolase [Prochlorothrix sp.]